MYFLGGTLSSGILLIRGNDYSGCSQGISESYVLTSFDDVLCIRNVGGRGQ
jgi:hypothetical protein